nr:hypothetical protein [Mycolicibacterium canariasense]
MCRAVTCRVCGKTTWAGCGMHVDAVRRGVPAGQWCAGHSAGDAAGPARRGWFGRRKAGQGKP